LYSPLIEEQDVPMHDDQLPSTTTSSRDAFGYEHLISRLYDLNEEMFGQSDGVIERISQEITRLSRGYLSIRWHQRGAAPPRSGPLSVLPSVPLQYGGRYYGELVTAVDPEREAMPLVPLAKVRVVASICGWLIYNLEVAALLKNQHTASHEFKPLRPREREILVLMAQDYGEQAIADALQIAPKTVQKHQENIFKRLGVHAAHHAVLSGFLPAQFSPLASLSPHAGNPYEEEETERGSPFEEKW
jgi:DNA-binding CsgD family transcriptional regulator